MNEQDITLSYHEIIRACGDDADWLVRIIEADIISVSGDPMQATYSGYQLDFEASAPATALILQLLDELENLRKGR